MSKQQDVLTLTIYGRKDCQLCDKLIAALTPWQNRYTFAIHEVDIDTDTELTSLYAARIPVLTLGDVEICQYFLDEQRLQQVLSESSRENLSTDKY